MHATLPAAAEVRVVLCPAVVPDRPVRFSWLGTARIPRQNTLSAKFKIGHIIPLMKNLKKGVAF